MPGERKKLFSKSELRRKAEALLKKQAGRLKQFSAKDIRMLAQELGTYQIELEIQNENLRSAQEQIEVSRQKYYDLYDFAPVGYLTFDKNGLILEVNLTGSEILGSGKKNLIGKPFSLYIEQKDRKIFRSHCLEVLKDKTRKSCELTMSAGKRDVYQVELQSIAMGNGNDGKMQIRTILTDITNRLKWVDELKAAKDAAEAADRTKSSFLSNMSHELRTPLNAILGYAQVLKKETNLTENQKNDIDAIRRSGESLLGIINNILDFTKLEAGKMSSFSSSFNLYQFLDTVLETIRVQAQEKKLNLLFITGQELPAAVTGDEAGLKQVLLNLLSNAVKFTKTGDIILAAGGSRLKPAGAVQKYKLHFEIMDTGIGISAADLEKIFEPFEQVREMKFDTKGTGLGLSISRQLIRLMGSELCVRSGAGGSVFWFDLILEGAEDPDSVNTDDIKKTAANPPEMEVRILPPPSGELADLLAMAKKGDIIEIRKWINKTAEDKKYSAFTGKIKRLAGRIKLDDIKKFVNLYIKPAESGKAEKNHVGEKSGRRSKNSKIT